MVLTVLVAACAGGATSPSEFEPGDAPTRPEEPTRPVFTGDVPIEPRPSPAVPAVETEAPALHALHFAPVSLFATHLSLELERALNARVSVFGAIGGSVMLQTGLELGLRAWLTERALSGLFVGAQATLFYFAQARALLSGPGVHFGYALQIRRYVLTFGAGLHLWTQLSAETEVVTLGINPRAAVVFLPGLQRPLTGAWAPQPMLRFTVGPAF